MAVRQIKTLRDAEIALIDLDTAIRKLQITVADLVERVKKLEDATNSSNKR